MSKHLTSRFLFYLVLFMFSTLSTLAQASDSWVKRYDRATNDDIPCGIVVGPGDIYVGGSTYNSSGNLDYTIVCYWLDGTIYWDTAHYNGTDNGDDIAHGIAKDNSGDLYITGGTHTNNQGDDYATVKYDSEGKRKWVEKHNGTSNQDDIAYCIVVDDSNYIYVTGVSKNNVTNEDIVTIKYKPADGAIVWTRTFDSLNGSQVPYDMALDANYNLYITGTTALPGAESKTDIVTLKYDSTGTFKWHKTYGSADSNDQAFAITVDKLGLDPSNNIHVTGYSYRSGKGDDYVTIKYTPAGTKLWHQYYNGTGNGNDWGADIMLDKNDNVYVTGHSKGNGANDDFATIKYNSNGVQQWEERYNGPANGDDMASALVVDYFSGEVYVTGTSIGDTTLNDYVTLKYDTEGNELWLERYDGPVNSNDWSDYIKFEEDDDERKFIFITGSSVGDGTDYDFLTIKYFFKSKPEKHSFFLTQDKKKMFANYFHKLINRYLGSKAQDLGIGVFRCHSGGFAEKAVASKYLKGQWSVTASCRKDFTSVDDTDLREIELKNGETVEGLKIGTQWYHGFYPQYIKFIKESGGHPGPETKATMIHANEHNPYCKFIPGYTETDIYSSSGEAADDFKLHGGTASNHAILFVSSPTSRSDSLNLSAMFDALKSIGYTDETIDVCFANIAPNPEAKSPYDRIDRKGYKQNFMDALTDLSVALGQNNNEKALIISEGHGGWEERKVEWKIIKNPPPGKRKSPEIDDNVCEIPLDSVFIAHFLEEVTQDDTLIYRVEQPQILVTTNREWVWGNVELLLNDYSIGYIYMQASDTGGDYELDVPDSAISYLAPFLETDDTLYVQFNLPSDSFRVATDYDFQDTLYPYSHYGIGVTVCVGGDRTEEFLIGDANADGEITVSDVVYLINYLFKGGPAPIPIEAGDANCDGQVSVGDVIYLINYLFKGGPPPVC